jgi:prophage regulatory protein
MNHLNYFSLVLTRTICPCSSPLKKKNMTASPNSPLAILRCKQVQQRTGLSRSTIYDRLSTTSPRFDPTFPSAIQLGANSVGWLESEIEDWISSRVKFTRIGV